MSHKKSQESWKNFISNIISLKYLAPVPGKENSRGAMRRQGKILSKKNQD